jgi:hypothetical protein
MDRKEIAGKRALDAPSESRLAVWTVRRTTDKLSDDRLRSQEAVSLSHRDVALQQEGADLIDDAGALADQPCD